MSSRPMCSDCGKYVTLGGCNCPEPNFGVSQETKSKVPKNNIDSSIGQVSYSWDDVKNATNRLYTAFFNQDIKDYVGEIAHNALPSCIIQLLAYCAVYTPVDDQLLDDFGLLCQAYMQLEEEGKIGNGK